MTEATRLVRIPRHLLHVGLDDLAGLGVPASAHDALRNLLADLPMVPDASFSAQLIGPPEIALACLASLARHVGQGLRDHNLSLAHDRSRLHAERLKLVFLEAEALIGAVANGDQRPLREAVLFVVDATPDARDLLAARESGGRASFVTTVAPLAHLPRWHRVHLTPQDATATE